MAISLCLAAAAVAAQSQQVHVSLGMKLDELNVAWVTQTGTGRSTVAWGLDCNSMTESAVGDVRAFTQDPGRKWYTRTATMSGLKLHAEYCYKVGVDGVYGEAFRVTNRLKASPEKHVIFGDMGARAAFSLCDRCHQYDEVCDAARCQTGNTSVGLISEVSTSTLFYHVGDFAYNFADNNGTTGDNFMINIEQVAARIPYMVAHGNHEDFKGNLEHYVERFRNMPANGVPNTIVTQNGEAANSLYFSFDQGLVHYVSYSTELWEKVGTDKVNVPAMLRWLEADLAAANANRHNVPWVIVSGHRALYTSEPPSGTTYPEDEVIKRDMEPILFRYGVDLFLNGHIHNYERMWPTFQNKSERSYVDPNATIFIVTGAAGSKEMSSPFQRPPPSYSAFRSNTFSYSRMYVHNATHIHWQQVLTDPIHFKGGKYGDILDDVWFVQHNHGPFSVDRAPKESLPTQCTTHDHFTPQMLGIDDGSNRDTYLQVMDYKRKHGTAAFARKMKDLLERINRGSDAIFWEEESIPADTRGHFKWTHDDSQ